MLERRYADGKRHAMGILKQTMCGWLQRFCFSHYFIFYSTHVKTRTSRHTRRSSAEEFDITPIINHALPHRAQLAHESS